MEVMKNHGDGCNIGQIPVDFNNENQRYRVKTI